MRLTRDEAKKYLKTPLDTDTIIYQDGDTADIIKVIEIADKLEAEKRNVKKLAQILRGSNELETCRNIWTFVRKNIKYKADVENYERVKVANKTIFDGYGDCKSFSILEASLLRELGIKAKYRFVSWEQNADITHVYIVAILRGGEEVIMDAVHTRFNEEVRYAYKKEKNTARMAVIALVQNIPNQALKPTFLDFSQMTDGEFSLQILKDRLKLLLAVHPDAAHAKHWRKGVDLVNNAINKGIHGVSANTGFIGFMPKELGFVAQKIKDSKTRFAPAAEFTFLNNRKHVGDGTDPVIQNQIHEQVCGVRPSPNSNNASYYHHQLASWNQCAKQVDEQNETRNNLNRTMPKSCHHFIYEFTNPNLTLNSANTSFATKLKITEHKMVLPQLVSTTKISLPNFQDWARLCIERQHATENLGVMSPETAIATLQDYTKTWKYDRNGDPIPAIGCPPCLVILAVAVLVGVAGTVIGGLMQIARDKEPTAFQHIKGILEVGFKATGKDWIPDDSAGGGGGGGTGGGGTGGGGTGGGGTGGGGTGEESSLSKYALPAAGAAIALYMLAKD